MHHEFFDGGDPFRFHCGDAIAHMQEMPRECIDHAVFSPPFPALYAYQSSESDIGNSEGDDEMRLHLSYFYRALARVLKPGRVAICHVMQIPRMARAGGKGLNDFRGINIRLAERAGLIFAYDWIVRKNPQSQAIRTRSRELQFAGLESDRANSRGCLGDYLLKFIAPGENDVKIDAEGQVSRDEWIRWAECCWDDIRETDTINYKIAKEEGDTKHICPLQLQIYERCIRLFSNPGEVVLDPFAGVGSCGYVCLGGRSPVTGSRLLDARRHYGIELKESYARVAVKHCEDALRQSREAQRTLFDFADDAPIAPGGVGAVEPALPGGGEGGRDDG